MRIKVVWCNGKAWDYATSPKAAYESVASLKAAGFHDAHVDWLKSDVK